MPYKIDIFELLKSKWELDDSALLVWAVNTIAKQNWKIKWYNTDLEWILLPIQKQLWEKIKEIKTSYIFGSGGSAQAVVTALLKLWIKNIKIFNRSEEKANDMIKHFNSKEVKKIIEKNLLTII